MRIAKAKLVYQLAHRGWHLKTLAEKSGVSQVTIYAMSGGKSVAPATAGKIAAALGVPLEKILERGRSL